MRGIVWAMLAGTAMLAACAPASPRVGLPATPGSAATSVAASPTPAGITSPGAESPMSIPSGGQPAVDAAIREAVGKSGGSASDITLVKVEEREWPDSSLGCPQQGMLYAQVITPGYLVEVRARGKVLEYHTDSAGRAVFCREK